MPDRPGSISSALVWMFLLSVLLFWLPLIGPLVAGFVGGRKAGSVGNAVLAAILPGLIFGAIVFFMASILTGLPIFGFLAGAGGFALAAAHIGPSIDTVKQVMSSPLYLLGCAVIILGLALGAYYLKIPPRWIVVGVIVLVGMGLTGAARSR